MVPVCSWRSWETGRLAGSYCKALSKADHAGQDAGFGEVVWAGFCPSCLSPQWALTCRVEIMQPQVMTLKAEEVRELGRAAQPGNGRAGIPSQLAILACVH